MPEQIYIGNFTKGLKTDRLPFNIDNDAFPTLYNFYAWRGRVKRKRGTIFLGQLQAQLQSANPIVSPWQIGPLNLVAGVGQLIGGFSITPTATIAPGSLSLVVGGNTYTEPSSPDGTLLKNGLADPGSQINYATGQVTIAGGGVGPLTGLFSIYTGFPVMGLEDFTPPPPANATVSSKYPVLLAFDTTFSYQIKQTSTAVNFYRTSFYKNSNVPFVWSGNDYQQFWSCNYSGALWATNNKPGFHFVNGTYNAGSGTPNIIFTFISNAAFYTKLQVNDVLWFNEWTGSTINGICGVVTVLNNPNLGQYTVSFSTNQVVAGTGIAQLLTNSIVGQDGIKWYDGDPTGGTGIPTGTGLGWVNFAPPLTATNVSIDNNTFGLFYLVGALAIVPFKDRLLFFSPYIQTSSGLLIQLQDTVIWSWNGTPYYTVSAPNTPFLVPSNQTADVTAYYVDQTGKGGFLAAGISQPIITISNNQDVLLIGFGGDGRKTRFVYTGNDLQPFLFFNINSELPSSATFSAVTLDRGAIDIGQYGIAMTDQQSSQRIDLDIPDSVFQIRALDNGTERVNAVRDFFREWIYFSYPVNNSDWKFPTQTFMFNYRDNTWAIFYENFTHHGTYRAQNKKTWKTLGFKSWAAWREPWNTGSSSPLFPSIIAGNPQGYVLIKGQGTGEGKSGTIYSIASAGGNTQIVSINHCVRVNDYLLIDGCVGTTSLNGQIGKVIAIIDANNFVVDVAFPTINNYAGLGSFTRLSQPLLQTKQFNPYWDQGRQARLSTQKYLMDFTADSQVTVNVYLSQNPDEIWNDPQVNAPPNSLIYSQLMYTCPESTNIGLTPANTNLQMPTAEGQYQIWHRFNTSLIGDSFQLGITLSDAQMRNLTYATSDIVLHGMHLTLDKGPHLA